METTTLTEKQKHILDGHMLGDGHLSIGGKSINARLKIGRCLSDKIYSEWTAEQFEFARSSKSLAEYEVFDPRYGKTYGKSYYASRRHPLFTEVYEKWYGGLKKHVPSDLMLFPETVAVWFADDGCLYFKTKNGITAGVELSFGTNGFTKDESFFLTGLLNTRYRGGFNCYGGYTIHPDQYKIYASTKPALRLLRDIDPVFPPLTRKSDKWRNWPRFYKEPQPFCPECGEDTLFLNGIRRYTTKLGVLTEKQRISCSTCSYKTLHTL